MEEDWQRREEVKKWTSRKRRKLNCELRKKHPEL